MSTVYASKHNDVPAQPKARKFRKRTIAGVALAGLVVAGGTAWAAVAIFGFGSFSSDAGQAKELTVSNTGLTKTLAPGQTVGVKGTVHNPNDYDVTVTGLIVRNSSIRITGGTVQECQLSLGSDGKAASYPAHNGATPEAGTSFTLAKPVTVPAGWDVEVTVPDVVTQSAKATKFCGVSADYAVSGAVGS